MSAPITGVVKTDGDRSGCEFFVCERAEWEPLNEDQRRRLLIDAMWESGLVDVYVKEDSSP
jgi:predicted Fe-S protein YdhL (DUF1289 family)